MTYRTFLFVSLYTIVNLPATFIKIRVSFNYIRLSHNFAGCFGSGFFFGRVAEDP